MVALAFFLVLGSIQMMGWGSDIREIEIDEENLPRLPVVPSPANDEKAIKSDTVQMITDINGLPLFSDDRQPFKDEPQLDPVDNTTPVISELKAKITGIVITPEQSYATILDTVTNERVTYQVGMPLEGEQGGWTLNSIESRKVTFVSDENETEELELEVYSGNLKGGSGKNKGKNGGNGNNKKNNKNSEQKNSQALTKEQKKQNADEIRRKIAERRAQMRAQAAQKQNK